MAVETLSPDWEFDRVDDGSQSKGAAGIGLRVGASALASALAAFLREGLRRGRCAAVGLGALSAH